MAASARFARAHSRQSSNRANHVLDASPQSPADLSTGRLATTLLPSLFIRSGVCGEIVNELARICTSSLLIFQKICSLTIFISFSPSPMLGRMELCDPSNLPFSSPLCWEIVEPGCLTCCHLHTFLGKLSQSKQITSTKCTSPRGLADLLSGPNAGTGYFIL